MKRRKIVLILVVIMVLLTFQQKEMKKMAYSHQEFVSAVTQYLSGGLSMLELIDIGNQWIEPKVIFRTNAGIGNYVDSTWIAIDGNKDGNLEGYGYGGKVSTSGGTTNWNWVTVDSSGQYNIYTHRIPDNLILSIYDLRVVNPNKYIVIQYKTNEPEASQAELSSSPIEEYQLEHNEIYESTDMCESEYCGNGLCNIGCGEETSNCIEDCPIAACSGAVCGNLKCDSGCEDAISCPVDCDPCSVEECGNDFCLPECGETDMNCPDDCIVPAEYVTYFNSNPQIKSQSIDGYDSYTTSFFWGYINELESTGRIGMEEPTNLCNLLNDCPSNLKLTGIEWRKILGAKAAHSIWLDKNNILPWKLGDYSESELSYLFKKEKLFLGDEMSLIFDYSPSETYDYAQQFIGANKEQTVYAMLDDFRYGYGGEPDFRHFVASDPVGGVTYQFAVTARYGEPGRDMKRVSSWGCHTMTRIVGATLRNLNIASYEQDGWMYGSGHSTEFISQIGIMIHGDDIYDVFLDIPNDEFLMTWDYFNANIEPCGRYTTCAKDAVFEFWIPRYDGQYTFG